MRREDSFPRWRQRSPCCTTRHLLPFVWQVQFPAANLNDGSDSDTGADEWSSDENHQDSGSSGAGSGVDNGVVSGVNNGASNGPGGTIRSLLGRGQIRERNFGPRQGY